MDHFEYISVLTSLIIGLGLAHLLRGCVQMIHHPEEGRPYWVHLIWVYLAFQNAVFWWWFEFGFADVEQWTFGLYAFILFYGVLIFLGCAILFPTNMSSYDGYKDFFYSRRRWIFGIFIARSLTDVADTLLKGVDHYISLGPQYWFGVPAQVTLMLVAMKTMNERFHGLVAILLFLQQFSIILNMFQTID